MHDWPVIIMIFPLVSWKQQMCEVFFVTHWWSQMIWLPLQGFTDCSLRAQSETRTLLTMDLNFARSRARESQALTLIHTKRERQGRKRKSSHQNHKVSKIGSVNHAATPPQRRKRTSADIFLKYWPLWKSTLEKRVSCFPHNQPINESHFPFRIKCLYCTLKLKGSNMHLFSIPVFLTHAVSKRERCPAVVSPGIERCFLVQGPMFLSCSHPVNAPGFFKKKN